MFCLWSFLLLLARVKSKKNCFSSQLEKHLSCCFFLALCFPSGLLKVRRESMCFYVTFEWEKQNKKTKEVILYSAAFLDMCICTLNGRIIVLVFAHIRARYIYYSKERGIVYNEKLKFYKFSELYWEEFHAVLIFRAQF